MNRKHLEWLSPKHRLGVELSEAFNIINDTSQEFFAKFDLTSQQYNILAILQAAGGPLSTSDILEWMIEKNAGVSRLVDRLVKKALVTKKANETDKRLIDVELTEAGKALYSQVEQQLGQLDERFSTLTDEETKQLTALLMKITGNL